MKKFFVAFAMIMASMITMAQSQFYVIMKDGSGTSFPEDVVDHLTFDNDGNPIYGFNDILKRMDAMQKTIDSLKNICSAEFAQDEKDYEHEYVDLELPSGILWATTNVGAKRDYETGKFFAFGETYPKESYSAGNYKYNEYTESNFTSNAVIGTNGNLTGMSDAASKYWGSDWKTPSSKDFEELAQYCTCILSESHGVAGLSFVSRKNGKSVFFPYGGYFKGTEIIADYRGYYMTSTLGYSDINNTFYLDDVKGWVGTMNNTYGKLVRPVKTLTNENKEHTNENIIGGYKYVDLGLPSKTLWAQANVGAETEYDAGELFKWGELDSTIRMKNEASLWMNVSNEDLLAQGVIDETGNLTPEHDVATVRLGYYWKTPSYEDLKELFDKCEVEWMTIKDQPNGVKFTGPNGNTLYLTALFGYWTSTVSSAETAYHSYLSSGPITEKDPMTPLSVDLSSPNDKRDGSFIRPVVRK